MLVQKLSELQELVDTLTKEVQRNSVMLPRNGGRDGF